ncbi:4910_t:CDS:2 [Paraglomus brasilianum]|uniref:Protein farnesyltransferase/geranylgeranyltransferase type-1 subunit alpha n=1 Tax=Paraglomus brasilianum TaxID=144538 RepID=A0A9N9F7Z9_9GLOM|nr:4910_t:CDS:2 [Paraglomus brasilianum]
MTLSPYDLKSNYGDVTPIDQDDGPSPIAPIAYSTEYSTAMAYFRALVRNNEKSKRALDLTSDIIKHNPAHYTVWNYRQQILFTLDENLTKELEFVKGLARDNPKNYQLWHHRQVIVEKLSDSSKELEFINEVLDDDAKNYHAWSYRQWINTHFNLWDDELPFIDTLLKDDVRNNSAWNHRHFVVFHDLDAIDESLIQSEINYTKEKIRQTPNNISPWNYLRGVLEKSSRDIQELESFCKEFTDNDINSMGWLVDIYENRAKNGDDQAKEDAIKICESLANKYDTIRKAYWEYRKDEIAAPSS